MARQEMMRSVLFDGRMTDRLELILKVVLEDIQVVRDLVSCIPAFSVSYLTGWIVLGGLVSDREQTS